MENIIQFAEKNRNIAGDLSFEILAQNLTLIHSRLIEFGFNKDLENLKESIKSINLFSDFEKILKDLMFILKSWGKKASTKNLINL